jgi:hypothetical protein
MGLEISLIDLIVSLNQGVVNRDFIQSKRPPMAFGLFILKVD